MPNPQNIYKEAPKIPSPNDLKLLLLSTYSRLNFMPSERLQQNMLNPQKTP